MKVAINILGTNSTINQIPMFFEFNSAREFTDFIRSNAIDILNWPFQTYGHVNNPKIGVYIREDIKDSDEYWEWNFIINCKNIREYKEYIKMDFEEFDAIVKAKERQVKLNGILDE